MKDGQPFRIVSGSIHYWRSLPQVDKSIPINSIGIGQFLSN